MKLSNEDRKLITRIYMVANTPAYLFDRLCSAAPVHTLADSAKPSQLTSLYKKVASKERRSVEDVAMAYAALVALTMKQPEPSRAMLVRLRSVPMQWGPAIIGLYLARPAKTTTASFTVPPPRPTINGASIIGTNTIGAK